MKRDKGVDNEYLRGNAAEGPAIQIKGLTKNFGRVRVLRSVDLEVPWGETLTILGPNGSGKTTLIKILATLTKADSGVARVGGLDVARYGYRVRRIMGVVAHDTMLYDELTAYENLKFFARMFDLDHIDSKIEAVVERMGMSDRLHDRVGTLSHGMKKRFTIARALLHDPLVLLMDEPESGLDQDALTMLDKVITDRSNDLRTVLMTTHNLERGLALGHRTAILSKGRIAYQESLEAVGASTVRDAYFHHTGAESQ